MEKHRLGIIVIFTIVMAALFTPVSVQAVTDSFAMVKGDKLSIGDNGFRDYKLSKKGIIKITKKGAIVAKKEGNVILKSGTKNQTFKVYVVKEPELSETSVEVKKGLSKEINVSNYGAMLKNNWTSADKKIASVGKSGHTITGLSEGSTVITVKLKGYTKTYTRKVTVTVTENKDMDIMNSIIKQQTGKEAVFFYNGTESNSEKRKYYNIDSDDDEAMAKLKFSDLSSDFYQWDDEGRLTWIDWGNYEDLKGEIDLSGLTALSTVYCNAEGVTGINVSDNIALTKLNCWRTSIQSLDVSNNVNLTNLNCSRTGIRSLDVSNNKNLISLYCYNTDISSLDISHNPDLQTLNCEETKLTKLEVINNPQLKDLRCRGGNSNGISELTLKNCKELKFLNCSAANLTQLDTSDCPNLANLSIDNNRLSEIDISKNTKLQRLYCYDNLLTQIDVRNNMDLNYCGKDKEAVLIGNFDKTKYYKPEAEALEAILKEFDNHYFDLEGNDITSLYFRWNDEGRLVSIDLSFLWLERDLQTGIKLSLADFPELRKFIGISKDLLNWFYISKLDVTNNPKLEYLDCANLVLENLDLSKNLELTYASVNGISYKSEFTRENGDFIIDLSNNKKLNYFSCNYLRAGGLKLGENTALTELNCYKNNFTQLDISGCSNLKTLDCSSNKLKELVLEKNTALETVKCRENEELTALDISKNTNLKHLENDSRVAITGDTSNLTH